MGDPFERVNEVRPLAVIDTDLERLPQQHHATDRDELVFRNESHAEVYKIDATLTRARVVLLDPEIDARAEHVTAFPRSPLAVLHGGEKQAFVVNTQTGKIDRRIPFPEQPEYILISPDERWLVLCLSALTVIDLRTGERTELASTLGGPASYYGTTFLGPNTLFLKARNASKYEVWDLRMPQPRWSGGGIDRRDSSVAAHGNSSRMVTGADDNCQFWDVAAGRVLQSHSANRPAWAVALHPKTDDYLAGYSMLNFSLSSRLDGAVRIWNADGVRLLTFAAHHDGEEPRVNWMAFSLSGEYLVTAGERAVKVWDYHALTKR